ncbi:MAG: class I SAM-dependent methyltransferase [Thermodesulfobacteriota bacterium]
MDDSAVIKAYKRYARNYDRIFGKIFEHGRKQLIENMNCRQGEKILEVGVGTGLSFPCYPEDVNVTGIDISPDMLEIARRYVNGSKPCRRSLFLMDAQRMSFADNSFDRVAAMYVVSVVPRPDTMMREIKRVCKPGGDIFVLNHFSNQQLLPRALETALLPFQNLLGFSPRFSLEAFLQHSPLHVVDTCPVNLFGYWTLIHARNI